MSKTIDLFLESYTFKIYVMKYLYSSIGLTILLIEAVRLLHGRLKGKGYLVLYSVLLLSTLWTSRTVVRNQAWQSRQSLFT